MVATALFLATDDLKAQRIEFIRTIELQGGDSLHVPDPALPGTLIPRPEGGWFYTRFIEEWTWGEFAPDGGFIRAPGRRWRAGGPGELRRVRAVFPLDADTLIALEDHRAVRVLRDGTYLDSRFLPFRPGFAWSHHEGHFWISGPDLTGEGVPLLRLPLSEGGTARVQAGARGARSGQPVSWAGALWLWIFPRGPLVRVDPASGAVQESWQPPIGGAGATWRAFATSGPNGTLVFRIDPRCEWVVFDADRNRILSQPIPQELRSVCFVDSRYALGFASVAAPVFYVTNLLVYEYRIVR